VTYPRISLQEPHGIFTRNGQRPGIRALTTRPWIIITLFRDFCFLQMPVFRLVRHLPHNTCTPVQAVPDYHGDSGIMSQLNGGTNTSTYASFQDLLTACDPGDNQLKDEGRENQVPVTNRTGNLPFGRITVPRLSGTRPAVPLSVHALRAAGESRHGPSACPVRPQRGCGPRQNRP
jgi:hypothetical protein